MFTLFFLMFTLLFQMFSCMLNKSKYFKKRSDRKCLHYYFKGFVEIALLNKSKYLKTVVCAF